MQQSTIGRYDELKIAIGSHRGTYEAILAQSNMYLALGISHTKTANATYNSMLANPDKMMMKKPKKIWPDCLEN